MPKIKYSMEIDGKEHGCILDTENPDGDAVCFAEIGDGDRVQGTFKTLEDENSIRTVPVTKISADNPVDADKLLEFAADNLPVFQRQARDKQSRVAGVLAKVKKLRE